MKAPGFAVPLALLLLLAITGLAHGALLLARREAQVSRLAVRLLERELAGRGALLVSARTIDTVPALAVGEETALPSRARAGGPAVLLRIARLAPELHLLMAEEVGAGGAGALGLVVWSLDPLSRAARTPAAEAFTGLGEGRATAAAAAAGPDPCASVRAGLAGGGGALATASALPPGLGLLAADSLLLRAPLRVSGAVSPSPGTDPWRCPTDDPQNWGAPGDPLHPCAGYRPFVASLADLAVEGGEGQGVLAVRGDLTLRGARYRGLVLVGGRVRLEDGASVRGRVLAAGGVVVGSGSSVLSDACAVYLALRAARSLRAPLILPEGAWIRPL